MAAKNDGKTNFWEKSPDDSADSLGVKNFVKISLFHTISEINAFSLFLPEIKDGSQK